MMIRSPHKSERKQIIPLILTIMEDMELPILQEIDPPTFAQLLSEAMLEENFRYSLKNTLVCLKENHIAGALFGYRGELEDTIDHPFHALYPKYNINSTLPLYQDKETCSGEWYVDIISVYPSFRGQGIATALLKKAEQLAKKEREPLIALNCETNNTKALSLYQSLGYQIVSTRTLSGHLYYHLQKKI